MVYQLHLHAGTAGGEAQQTDIRSLRKEIELKKAKLNELREETKRWVASTSSDTWPAGGCHKPFLSMLGISMHQVAYMGNTWGSIATVATPQSTASCSPPSPHRKELTISRMRDDKTDAQRLTPGELSEEKAYIQQLQDEMKRIDEDLTEAEAKNRLYYLLGERTR
jgi:hypothetical protein